MRTIKVTDYVRGNIHDLTVDKPTDPLVAGEIVKFIMPDRIINTVVYAYEYPNICGNCVFGSDTGIRCPSYTLDDSGADVFLCSQLGDNGIIFKVLDKIMEDI